MFKEKLEKYLAACESDAALKTYAKRNKACMIYEVPDLKLSFYMYFGGGVVQCRQGTPPRKPDYTIKVDSDVLEEILTGELDGTAAGLSGALKFKGNMLKAMGLQKLNPEMVRIYKAANP